MQVSDLRSSPTSKLRRGAHFGDQIGSMVGCDRSTTRSASSPEPSFVSSREGVRREKHNAKNVIDLMVSCGADESCSSDACWGSPQGGWIPTLAALLMGM